MAVYIPDPWQAMPLGSAIPVGWTSIGSSLNEVRSFANGGAFFPHQWYALSINQLQSPLFGGSAPPGNLTVWSAWSPFNINTQGVMASLKATSNVGSQFDVAILKQENDATLSVYIGGSPSTLIYNTGSVGKAYWCQGISQNWYYFQWNVTLGTITVGGIKFLTVTTDLAVDGEIVFSGQLGQSNFITDTSFQHFGMNQIALENTAGWGELYVVDKVAVVNYPKGIWTVALTSGGNNTYNAATTVVNVTDSGAGSGAVIIPVIFPLPIGAITNLLIANGGLNYTGPSLSIVDTSGHGSGATATAALAPTPFRRIYQAAIDVIQHPTTSNAQVYQAAVELIRRPSTSNVQIFQAVIELLIQRTVVPGGSHVYEA